MPTFVELADANYPLEFNNQRIKPLDGMSFLPILKGQDVIREKPLFWQWKKGKAIRHGDWKMVAYDDQWALYNLKTDPVEENDLSKVNPEKYNELMAKYEAWSQDMGI
jgi:arylsulfatase